MGQDQAGIWCDGDMWSGRVEVIWVVEGFALIASFLYALLRWESPISGKRTRPPIKANGCLALFSSALWFMVMLCRLAIVVHGKDFVRNDSVVLF
jgi:hypothetical protein